VIRVDLRRGGDELMQFGDYTVQKSSSVVRREASQRIREVCAGAVQHKRIAAPLCACAQR
jgi:hypothetical protein